MTQEESRKTADRLKRLAKDCADAWAEMTWRGNADPADVPGIQERYRMARRLLHREIDRVCGVVSVPDKRLR